MNVAQIMRPNPVLVSPKTLVPHALRVGRACQIRHLLVAEVGEVVGVICVCDLWRASEDETVATRMSPPITISAVSPVPLARALMIHHEVDCLPVLREGHLAGVVTRRDLRDAGYPVPTRACARCGSTRHVRDVPESGFAACYDCRVAAARGTGTGARVIMLRPSTG